MDLFEPVPPGVLEYPLVQYIPLLVRSLAEVALPGTRPGLEYLPDVGALAGACSNLGVTPPPWDSTRLLLLLRGARAERCYYRAERAAMLGAARPGLAQLLSLGRQRIYKDTVVCILYDPEGQELCRCQVRGARL